MIQRMFAALALASLIGLGCGRPTAPPREVETAAEPPTSPEKVQKDDGKKPRRERVEEHKDDKPEVKKPVEPARQEPRPTLPPRRAGALPPFERRLPPNTRGFFSIPDVPRTVAAWEKTSLASLWKDPAMKPFHDDNQSRVDRGLAFTRWTLGLQLRELSKIVTGELGVTVVHSSGAPALVLLADVGGKTEQADALLQTAADRFVRGGAQRSEQKSGEQTFLVITLPSGLQKGQLRQLVYARKGDLLVAGSTLEAASTFLGSPKGGLGESEAFRESTALAEKDLAGAHLRWFIRPLAFWRAFREIEGTRPRKPDLLPALESEGFEALQSLGGAALLATPGQECLTRTYVFAPGPYKRSMRMLSFAEVEQSLPPAFAPAKTAGCLALALNWPESFDAYGTLFDALYGDGEKGVFEDIIRGTRDDPDGPRVDIRREIVRRLEQPLWVLSLRLSKSEPLNTLRAIPVTAEKSFAGALRRVYEGEEDVKVLPFGEYGMFQAQEKKKGKKSGQSLSALAGAVAVYQRHLLLGAKPEEIRAVAEKPSATLAESAELKEAFQQVAKEVGEKAFLRGMFRQEEMIRDSFQRLRQGSRDESDGIVPILLRVVLPWSPTAESAGMTLLPDVETLKEKPRGNWIIAGVNRKGGWVVRVQLPRTTPREP